MACNKVKAYLQSSGMGIANKIDKVGIGTETRIYLIVIRNVISTVFKLAAKDRTYPYSIEAYSLDIIQLRAYALKVPISVTVAVHERRRIHMIYYSRLQPPRVAVLGECHGRGAQDRET
jgi:hypothetical protein